jgi:hypothetical protein
VIYLNEWSKLEEAWNKFLDDLGTELHLFKLLDWLNKKLSRII